MPFRGPQRGRRTGVGSTGTGVALAHPHSVSQAGTAAGMAAPCRSWRMGPGLHHPCGGGDRYPRLVVIRTPFRGCSHALSRASTWEEDGSWRHRRQSGAGPPAQCVAGRHNDGDGRAVLELAAQCHGVAPACPHSVSPASTATEVGHTVTGFGLLLIGVRCRAPHAESATRHGRRFAF